MNPSFLAACTLVALFAGLPIVQREAGDVESGTIEGSVLLHGVSLENSPRGVASAIVTLNSVTGGVRRTVTTDASGRFRFLRLPAATYRIAAEKAGYVRAELGARTIGGAGVPLTLRVGEFRHGLQILLARGAVITGTIFDDKGAPSPGKSVILLRRKFVAGRTTLVKIPVIAALTGHSGDAISDDRGIFRLYGVSPGSYLVATARGAGSLEVNTRRMSSEDVSRAMTPIGSTAASSRDRGVSNALTAGETLVPVYFPGTVVASEARPIELEPGQEVGGVDIMLQSVATSTVTGVVRGLPGDKRQTAVQLVNEEVDTDWLGVRPTVSVSPDGQVRLSGLVPGRYRMEGRTVAESFAAPSDGAPRVHVRGGWASHDFVVSGAARSASVSLTLVPTVRLAGRVESPPIIAGTSPPAWTITLLPVPVVANSWQTGFTTVVDGRGFESPDLVPGRYRVLAVASRSSRLMFAGVSIDGRPAIDELIEIERDANLVVHASQNWTELAGHVEDQQGQPTAQLTAVVFSVSRGKWYWRSRHVAAVRVADDGTFRVSNLPAGPYLLAVVPDPDPDRWFDPDYLEALVPGAISLELAARKETTQRVRLAGQ